MSERSDEGSMERGKVVAGKYRLNQLLGSGGMAEVWSATNTFTERQLAIKFMNQEVAKTPEAAARFLKEAKVSARINHPNIIDIQDVGQTEDGQLFLVMELLTGFPLEVALRRQNPTMSLYELVLVMVDVAEALSAAHKAGIVHRDLKPTNIFLHSVKGGSATPKLLDFGVSKFLEDDQNHALTMAGTVLGSPLYMSPEQARGDANLDGKTDVFAFGAILFEALAGYRAYDAKNFNALIVKIATTKPKSIDACAPHVPESLRAVVRACLEVDPKKRMGSFDDVVKMLRATMPELKESPLRLPTPLVATAVVDPDATNALPVLRATGEHLSASQVGRPPPVGPVERPIMNDTIPSLPPGSIPAQTPAPPLSATVPPGASWHTPNTSYASVMVPPPKRHPIGLIAIAIALVVGGIGIGAVVTTSQHKPAATTTTAATIAPPAETSVAVPPPSNVTPSATTIAAGTTTISATTDTPTISVDALPSKPTGPIAKGAGRLSVNATPGWCAIVIDGKDRGPTPIAAIDLSVGPHQVTCKTPSGKARTTTLVIQDGATAKYSFSLE
jgi:eukaryotic-like serine/threonine-protein kinase